MNAERLLLASESIGDALYFIDRSTPPSHALPAGATRFVYRPRRPTTTPIYPVVQHHLETFLATAEREDSRGWGTPSWVERDFRAYLRCGVLAHGFGRIRCDSCGHERLLAFSCKGRGVCPSCNARRMAEVAEFGIERKFREARF